MNTCCNGVTTRNEQCKKAGKWNVNDKWYCSFHISKKKEMCSICLNHIIKAQYVNCGHYFHKKCITKWMKINNTCPVCRIQFSRINHLNMFQSQLNDIDDDNIYIAIDIALQSKNIEEFKIHIKILNNINDTNDGIYETQDTD